MEASFTPERVVLFPESISVNFERGSLPSQEHDYSLSSLPELPRDWAMPVVPR